LKETEIDAAVDLLLRDAADSGVTELFLEPLVKDAVVRVRRDGLLHEWFHQAKESHERFIRHLKVLARLREDVDFSCQENPLRRVVDGVEIEGRLSVVPVPEGEKAVVRFRVPRPGLADLGLSSTQRDGLRRCLKKTSGLLLLAGPRRSGLTTTLYALLEETDIFRRHASLIETVSQADLHGIDQEAVDPVSGRATASLLRAAIARGAGIIGLGSLREEAAAALAVSAAEHRLVIAVVEGKTLSGALNRLLELRVEPKAVARVLSGVLLQRLARRVCPDCQRRYTMTAEEARVVWPLALMRPLFGKNRTQAFVRGAKCAHCRFTGHRGQLGVFEWRDLLVPERRPSTLLDDGVRKVLSGAIAPEELMRL
jgi:type II secretory ATPase GspE/PulE/Tfp pilus assembly ATPase PilB-like protein